MTFCKPFQEHILNSADAHIKMIFPKKYFYQNIFLNLNTEITTGVKQ